MSHCCLATVNINHFLTSYAKESFLAACDRWGSDFAEIHAVLKPECPSCSKYLVPSLLRGYDKLMLLDADTVISPTAPSPFALCDRTNTLYAVSDYQAPNQCDAWRVGPYLTGMAAALTWNTDFKTPPPELFFNAGMWMCRPKGNVLNLFSAAAAALPDPCDIWTEQGTINVFAHNWSGVEVCLLPETWNHMIPQDCAADLDLYINHYGGWAHDLLKRAGEAQPNPYVRRNAGDGQP